MRMVLSTPSLCFTRYVLIGQAVSTRTCNRCLRTTTSRNTLYVQVSCLAPKTDAWWNLTYVLMRYPVVARFTMTRTCYESCQTLTPICTVRSKSTITCSKTTKCARLFVNPLKADSSLQGFTVQGLNQWLVTFGTSLQRTTRTQEQDSQSSNTLNSVESIRLTIC